MKGASGHGSLKEAEAAVKSQIDAGFPVPFLLAEAQKRLHERICMALVYAGGICPDRRSIFCKDRHLWGSHWLSLTELWNTGYEERGGMILYEEERNSTNTQNYFEKSEDMLYNKK